ncbi:MAG: energy transducer TonB [Verrucomicrobia bacterium]|jgi:periplasmic protein TonB|nr:energy transducer TonB [Verrucomicrobiota bacterium]
MREVYIPPKAGAGHFATVMGSIVITALVFLVLPLSQFISSGGGKKMQILEANVSEPPPPPPPPPPAPEEEEKEEEPEPEMEPEPQQLSLADLDLDLSGSGLGSLGGGGGQFMDGGGGLDDMALFDVSDLDKPPVPVSQPAPRYPNELKKEKINGSAIVVFILSEEGQVLDPRVESASHPAFEKAALDAIRRWRFKPGMKAGKPVRSNIRQPFTFKVR